MPPLKIYMADVTHDTILLVTDTIPINIGLLGSYAKFLYGDDIEISRHDPNSVSDRLSAPEMKVGAQK